MKNLKQVLITLSALLLLSGCGPGGQNVRPQSNNKSATLGLQLYQSGDFMAAADWLQQAHQKEPENEEVVTALLDSWYQLGEYLQALNLINQSQPNWPAGRLIAAEMARDDERCPEAATLTAGMTSDDLPMSLQRRLWGLQGQCLAQVRDHLGAAKALIKLNAENDEISQAVVNDQIVRQLLQVPEQELLLAIEDLSLDPVTEGWITAAFVSFGADGMSGGNWLQRWPEHPAGDYFLDSNRIEQRQDVAVLLPFSGRFANLAKTIQRGMLTAAAEDPMQQASLMFYDTGGSGEHLASAWYTAQEDAVDIMIGPLDKGAIKAVEDMPAATMPVVLLNQSESSYHQFTLSPEGEAEGVADRMIRDGRKRVIILAPNNPWGERLTQAFAQRFVDQGGQIVNNSYFQTEQNDYSAQLRQLLGLVESQLRARNLQQFLKINLDAEPAVRTDVDAIFIAARPAFARLLVPQLKFFRAAQIPTYATSHVFDGISNEQHNKDLDGVRFSISPLELATPALLETLSFDLEKVQNHRHLFAFGYDAYQLISRLEWMSRVNMGVVDGLSGQISLGFDGVFRRELQWAQYRDGLIDYLPR